jgi:uncharacterized protein with PIN domain
MAAATRIDIRVYGSLNDFLAPERRHLAFTHEVPGRPSVKDLAESVGIPHPEVDLILVNGTSVSFDYSVGHGDRIAVFPRFMAIDIEGLSLVRPPALTGFAFVLDVHLGRLARHLRLLGVDAAYRASAEDSDLADVATRERRILLTRDVGLLKRRIVTYGYFIRETDPDRQLVEVLRRFGPFPLLPFSRCLQCNAELYSVSKEEVEAVLEPQTREHYQEFSRCPTCRRVYWKGSHWRRLTSVIESALQEAQVM